MTLQPEPDIQCFDSWAGLAPLKKSWDSLLYRSTIGFVPFVCWAWIKTWLDFFADEYDPYVLAVQSASGDLVALFPFARRKGRRRALEFIGKKTSNLLDIIVAARLSDREKEAVYGCVCQYLHEHKTEWDYIFNFAVDEEDSEYARFLNFAKDRYAVLRTNPGVIFKLDCDTSFDDYTSSKSRHWRRKIKDRQNKLKKLGNVEFVDDGCVKDVDWLVETCHGVDERSWKGDEDEGILWFTDARQGDFYRRVLPALADQQLYSLLRLVIDGTTVAYRFQIKGGDCVYFCKTSYDNEVRKLAPGILISYEAIRKCIDEDGVRTINFMPGYQGHKERFATRQNRSVRAFLFSPTIRGKLWRQATAFKRSKAYDFMKKVWTK